jgi:hypothetical protein
LPEPASGQPADAELGCHGAYGDAAQAVSPTRFGVKCGV